MSPAGWPTAGGSSWSPRATGLPSGWPSCSAARASAPGPGIWPSRRSRASRIVTTGMLEHGFSWPSVRLAVLSESDLAGQRAGTRDGGQRMPSRRRGGIDPLQLTPGDYIVHEQHGVGRYLEMTSRTVQGATREYLVIEYAPGKRGQPPDRLYLPTDQLDEVTRYVGGEAPTLHRLGGADWAKTKGRARKAVREIAAELIRLYSARTASPGHAFGPDTPVAARARGRVPVRRDPGPARRDRRDQAGHGEAGPDGPADLRRRRLRQDRDRGPRGVQGRAGRQAGRGAGADDAAGPAAHRRRSASGTRRSRSRSGRCPGSRATPRSAETLGRPGRRHRRRGDRHAPAALAGDQLQGLGLVIIDEEQRFGVEHKEYLKRLRTEVDVLSMSATPIPRTLEMGVAGIREMSTILTPPEERHPVLTFVGPYDEKQIAAAIRRELLRDGQVFFVHNRVASIGKVAARLADAGARGADRGRARPDERAPAREDHGRTSGTRPSTCWSAPPSSSPAWTSRTRTR